MVNLEMHSQCVFSAIVRCKLHQLLADTEVCGADDDTADGIPILPAAVVAGKRRISARRCAAVASFPGKPAGQRAQGICGAGGAVYSLGGADEQVILEEFNDPKHPNGVEGISTLTIVDEDGTPKVARDIFVALEVK
jgi:hypothetical protein